MINKKLLNQVAIAGVGVYIPQGRVTVEEIATVRRKDGRKTSTALGIYQKSVASRDEDSATMAIAAAQKAIISAKIKVGKIGAIFVGSESPPYAVKPTSTIVGEWLNIPPHYYAADLQFACKAGTAGIQIVAGLIESGMIEAGLVIGSDKAQSKVGDALEYSAASCAVAFILTKNTKNTKIALNATSSYSTDTPDFWRRQTQEFPEHAGRFTGEPAYFKHVITSTQDFLKTYQKKISDFNHVVFHMPNGKFPQKAAKTLKVSPKQLKTGFTVKDIGNPYAASSMLGLARVALNAKPKQTILVTSYGSGSGSDTFWFTQQAKFPVEEAEDLEAQLKANQKLTYLEYLQRMEVIS